VAGFAHAPRAHGEALPGGQDLEAATVTHPAIACCGQCG